MQRQGSAAEGSDESRVDSAYRRIKDEILNNRMPPGFQSPEPELAARFGMSRTPVREALIRLQSEGLVELIPRRGVRVLPISPNDMREIYELLTILEPEAAADLAKNRPTEMSLSSLEASTKDMEDALQVDDLARWAAADDEFHRELLRAKGNKRLSDFVNILLDQAHRARMVTLRLREKPVRSTADHRAILSAIAEGDAKAARTLFREHRERAAAELLGVLEKSRLPHL